MHLGSSQTIPGGHWGFAHAQQLARGMWFSFMKGGLPKVMVFLSDFVVTGLLPFLSTFFSIVSDIFPVALLYLEMGGYLFFICILVYGAFLSKERAA